MATWLLPADLWIVHLWTLLMCHHNTRTPRSLSERKIAISWFSTINWCMNHIAWTCHLVRHHLAASSTSYFTTSHDRATFAPLYYIASCRDLLNSRKSFYTTLCYIRIIYASFNFNCNVCKVTFTHWFRAHKVWIVRICMQM